MWTKSKFLGLSVGVHNIGQGCVSVLDYNEEYIVTFPNGYGRWDNAIHELTHTSHKSQKSHTHLLNEIN